MRGYRAQSTPFRLWSCAWDSSVISNVFRLDHRGDAGAGSGRGAAERRGRDVRPRQADMRVALLSLELIQVCGHLAARDTALAEATAGLRCYTP